MVEAAVEVIVEAAGRGSDIGSGNGIGNNRNAIIYIISDTIISAIVDIC